MCILKIFRPSLCSMTCYDHERQYPAAMLKQRALCSWHAEKAKLLTECRCDKLNTMAVTRSYAASESVVSFPLLSSLHCSPMGSEGHPPEDHRLRPYAVHA
jgi:hypothetical protein